MSGRHGRREEPRRVARAAAPDARAAASARTVAPVAVSPQHLAGRRRAAKQERHRRRQQRRRLVTAAAAVVALLAAITVGVVTLSRRDEDQQRSAQTARTQRTLLFQLRRPTGTAIVSALLAHDPATRQGAMVLVPSAVIAEVPGEGRLQYGQSLAGPDGPRLARATAADLVGVTVDASWVLTQPQLAALIDRLGGVTIDVDTQVVGVRGGRRVALAEPGKGQRLSGDAAASYAGLRGGGDELARLPRLQAVLDAVIEKLPAGAGLDALLRAVDPAPASPVSAVTPTLTGLQADLARDAVSAETLPVVPFDVGTEEPAYRIDPDGVRALTSRLLAASVPTSQKSGGNRVLVLNAVGTPGIGEKVRTKIVSAGFVYVSSRNQKPFGRPKTVVVVGDSRESSLEAGRRLALALGLPNASVEVLPRGQSIADLIVVVGKDFSA